MKATNIIDSKAESNPQESPETPSTKIPEPVVAPEQMDKNVPAPQTNVTPMVSPLKKYAQALPADFITTGKSKSAMIRELKSRGWSTGDIARSLNISYQHARNVLNQVYKGVHEVRPLMNQNPIVAPVQTSQEVTKPSVEEESKGTNDEPNAA